MGRQTIKNKKKIDVSFEKRLVKLGHEYQT